MKDDTAYWDEAVAAFRALTGNTEPLDKLLLDSNIFKHLVAQAQHLKREAGERQ